MYYVCTTQQCHLGRIGDAQDSTCIIDCTFVYVLPHPYQYRLARIRNVEDSTCIMYVLLSSVVLEGMGMLKTIHEL